MSAAAQRARAVKIARQDAPALEVLEVPTLWVPEAEQWLSTTASRVAGDTFSWMQSVHWVASAGVFVPFRSHGPQFDRTTIRLAQLLVELTPCRPGVEYLARRLGLSPRTVQYHLAMLRQAGLLAYQVRGTRVRGKRAQASEFVRVIPPLFDAALGIRTAAAEDGQTRVVGIADAGRALIAKLARKASRKLRKPRPKSPNSDSTAAASPTSRCTPMVGGHSGMSAADSHPSPPENAKLASGKPSCSPSKKTPSCRLNRVGRRFQLARQLIEEVPWLHRAAVPRIAWIVRDVADAGWSVTEVQGWLHWRGGLLQEGPVRRPSGMLDTLLHNAHQVLDSADKRHAVVEEWRDSQRAARARHIEYAASWQAPQSHAVCCQVESSLQQVLIPASRTAEKAVDLPTGGPDTLGAEELEAMRQAAWAEYQVGETGLVDAAVALLGQDEALRIYGLDLVQRCQRLAGRSGHVRMGAAA